MKIYEVITKRAYEDLVNPGQYAGKNFNKETFDIVKHVASSLFIYNEAVTEEVKISIKELWKELCNNANIPS